MPKNRIHVFLQFLGVIIFTMSTSHSAASASPWVVLKYDEDDVPVIMKVMEELPSESVRESFGWLTVVSWQYDGSNSGGMPSAEVSSQMAQLESAIDSIQEEGLCVQVYSKTGNGRKELVYYIRDRDIFMQAFNEALSNHPRYPLGIEFFEDTKWDDLQTVHRVFLGQGE